MNPMIFNFGLALVALLFAVLLIVAMILLRRSWLGAALLVMVGLVCLSLLVFPYARARRAGARGPLPPAPRLAMRFHSSQETGPALLGSAETSAVQQNQRVIVSPPAAIAPGEEGSAVQDGSALIATAGSTEGDSLEAEAPASTGWTASARVGRTSAEVSTTTTFRGESIPPGPPAYAPSAAPPAPRSRLPLPWTVVSVAALAGMIYLGYLFLDAGTRGHYTWTLRAVAVLGFAGICAALVMLHLGF